MLPILYDDGGGGTSGTSFVPSPHQEKRAQQAMESITTPSAPVKPPQAPPSIFSFWPSPPQAPPSLFSFWPWSQQETSVQKAVTNITPPQALPVLFFPDELPQTYAFHRTVMSIVGMDHRPFSYIAELMCDQRQSPTWGEVGMAVRNSFSVDIEYGAGYGFILEFGLISIEVEAVASNTHTFSFGDSGDSGTSQNFRINAGVKAFENFGLGAGWKTFEDSTRSDEWYFGVSLPFESEFKYEDFTQGRDIVLSIGGCSYFGLGGGAYANFNFTEFFRQIMFNCDCCT